MISRINQIRFSAASLLVLGLFLCAVVSAVNAQSPTLSSDWKIAYNVLKDGKADDYEVFVMNVDGSEPTNITNHPDVAWTYYAIPGKVLFISDRNACKRCYFLYESDLDGSNLRKVSNLQLEDSWMGSRKDGKELIVSGRVDTRVRFQLFIIERETGRYRQITNEPQALLRDPIFSPDGKRIVVAYKPDRTDRSKPEELFIMKADGTGRRQLTTYPPDDPLIKEYGYKAGPPQWNERFNFISYQSKQAGKQSIYAVTPDGKRQWKLTENKLDEGWHSWSPDGEWLVFNSSFDGGKRYDVVLMNYQTKNVFNLTNDHQSAVNQAPVFVATK